MTQNDQIKKLLSDASLVSENYMMTIDIAKSLLSVMDTLAMSKHGAIVTVIPDEELPKTSIELRINPLVATHIKMLLQGRK